MVFLKIFNVCPKYIKLTIIYSKLKVDIMANLKILSFLNFGIIHIICNISVFNILKCKSSKVLTAMSIKGNVETIDSEKDIRKCKKEIFLF
jgi:hypothetical protein